MIRNLRYVLFIVPVLLGIHLSSFQTADKTFNDRIVPPWQVVSIKTSLPQLKLSEQVKLEPIPPAELYSVAKYTNSYDWGNCTAFVASRIKVPDNLGNANTWAQRAAEQGYVVSNTPIPGAVAQSARGYYGHVAIVEEILGNQVKLIEANVLGLNVVDERWVPMSDYLYIYF